MLSDDNQLAGLQSKVDELRDEINQLKETNRSDRYKIARLTDSKENLLHKIAVKEKTIHEQRVRT